MTSFPIPSQTSSPPPSPPPRSAPRFPDEGTWPAPGYRSADTRAKVAQVAHGVTAVLALAAAVIIAQVFEMLDRAERFQLTSEAVNESPRSAGMAHETRGWDVDHG